jgi:hypothetical protein
VQPGWVIHIQFVMTTRGDAHVPSGPTYGSRAYAELSALRRCIIMHFLHVSS